MIISVQELEAAGLTVQMCMSASPGGICLELSVPGLDERCCVDAPDLASAFAMLPTVLAAFADSARLRHAPPSRDAWASMVL